MSRETNIDLICTLKKRGVGVSLRDNKAELLRKMGQSARKASPKPKAKPKSTPKPKTKPAPKATSSSSTPKLKKTSKKSKSPSSRNSNGMTRDKLFNHLKELIIRYVSDLKTIDDFQTVFEYIAHKMRDDIKAMGAIDTFTKSDYQSIWDEIEEHLNNLSQEWRMLNRATRENFEWIFLDRVSSKLYDTHRRHAPKSSKPNTPMRESFQQYDVTNEDELSNHILHLVERNVMSLKTLQDFEEFAIYMADELRYDIKTMGVDYTTMDYRSLWGEITDLLISLSVPYVDLDYDDQNALLKLFVKRISM